MTFINERCKLRTIILAAGKGTRMKSDLAKVLHPICGEPMLSYVVKTAKLMHPEEIIVIVGHQARTVEETFQNQNLIFIEQKQLLGTGHAVLQANERLKDYNGTVLILCGDVPFLTPSTLFLLLNRHLATKASVTVLTANSDNPTGYGRIVKKPGGEIFKIVEERDSTNGEKKISEINTGIYCAERKFLFEALMSLDNNNDQKEYYLTDIIHIAYKNCLKAESLVIRDHREVLGINTHEDLERACLFLKNKSEHTVNGGLVNL